MLLAPIVHIAVMELAHCGVDVPTVDRIDASAWGVLVFEVSQFVPLAGLRMQQVEVPLAPNAPVAPAAT